MEEEITLETDPTPDESIPEEEIQATEGVQPETDPDPDPKPEPEPEPLPPPEWLNETAPQAPQPPQAPQTPQYPYQPPPQQYAPPHGPPPGYPYPPPPQQIQQPPTQEQILERLLKDPNAVLSDVARQELTQAVGPIAARILDVEARQRQFIEARTNEIVGQAKKAIEGSYKEVLSKDDSFRGNEAVRNRVNGALEKMYREAVESARMGDLSKIESFNNPLLYEMTLIAAKRLEGFSGTPEKTRVGHTTETSSPAAVPQESVIIEADMEEALARLGKGARDKYIESMTKYGDKITFE